MKIPRSSNIFRHAFLYPNRSNNIPPRRMFLGLPPIPQVLKGKRKEYSERKLLGLVNDAYILSG